MTRVAGVVQVPLTAEDAAAVADWHEVFKPAGDAMETRELVARLHRASRHSWKSVPITRALAARAAMLGDVAVVWLSLLGGGNPISARYGALAALRFGIACRAKLRGRGRPYRTPEQLLKRIADAAIFKIQVDPRELRRLKKLARINAWHDRVKARGESLLTSTEPLRK